MTLLAIRRTEYELLAAFGEFVAYDRATGDVYALIKLPWSSVPVPRLWGDMDDASATAFLQHQGSNVGARTIAAAVNRLAKRRPLPLPFHRSIQVIEVESTRNA